MAANGAAFSVAGSKILNKSPEVGPPLGSINLGGNWVGPNPVLSPFKAAARFPVLSNG
jgi:hypothetical protein